MVLKLFRTLAKMLILTNCNLNIRKSLKLFYILQFFCYNNTSNLNY